MPDEEGTFYEVLSVDPDASVETIERAYRERVRELHPDVSERADARERFKRVTHAKEVLTDRRKRAHYDRLGHDLYLERERRGRTDRSDAASGEQRAHPPARAAAAGAAGAGSDANSAGAPDAAGSSGSAGVPGSAGEAGGSGAATSPAGRTAAPRDGATDRRSTADASDSAIWTADGQGRSGAFAVGEVLAAGVLAAAAAGSVTLALVPPPSEYAVAVLVSSWLIVSAIAGGFARAFSQSLPADPVRAQAAPAALLGAAALVAATTSYRLLAIGLAVYGGYAALFRTAALVAARWRSALPAAAVWFAATLPAAAVLYATRARARGVLGRHVADAIDVLPAVGTGATLAVVAAVAVAVAHGVLRLGRRSSRGRGF